MFLLESAIALKCLLELGTKALYGTARVLCRCALRKDLRSMYGSFAFGLGLMWANGCFVGVEQSSSILHVHPILREVLTASAKGGEGYWNDGSMDTYFEHIEPNYVWTQYICEFWASVTMIFVNWPAMVAVLLCGVYNGYHKVAPRFLSQWAVLGFGFLHAGLAHATGCHVLRISDFAVAAVDFSGGGGALFGGGSGLVSITKPSTENKSKGFSQRILGLFLRWKSYSLKLAALLIVRNGFWTNSWGAIAHAAYNHVVIFPVLKSAMCDSPLFDEHALSNRVFIRLLGISSAAYSLHQAGELLAFFPIFRDGVDSSWIIYLYVHCWHALGHILLTSMVVLHMVASVVQGALQRGHSAKISWAGPLPCVRLAGPLVKTSSQVA